MTLDTAKIRLTPYELMEALDAANIEARPVWKPLHMQPLIADCKFFEHADGDCVSERLFATGICLPSDSKITVSEQERVLKVVLEALGE